MTRSTHTDSRDGATEPEFYIPAGAGPSFVIDRVERVWTTLFDYQVGQPN
jgi:hypothetical protein